MLPSFLRVFLFLVVFGIGCATFTRPDPGLGELRARAVTQLGEEVEISATGLGREDARRDFQRIFPIRASCPFG
jgi:hypothetical protein